MINNNTAREHLMDNFINRGSKNSLNLDNTSMIATKDGFTFPITNILRQKYRGILIQNSVQLDLDDALFERYKFRPKSLCLKIYGTTDLWHLIIWLNDMTSVTQFNRRNIVVFNPDSMDIINKILELEKVRLLQNSETPEQIVSEKEAIRR